MKLVPNARNIALKAVSMWMMYLGFLSLNAPDLIYWLFERDTNPAIWSITGNLLFVAGVIGRLVDQGLDVTRLRAWLVAALVLIVPLSDARAQSYSLEEFDAVAVPHIARWEGEHRCKDDPSMHCAYLDRIASPPVWTVCQGETKGVQPDDRYTDAQCAAMLAREVHEYREGLHRYFTPVTQAERLTPERDAAYTSLAYNAGIRAIGRSTATRRLNAGDIAGGCKAIGWWNKAGDRVVRGLVNRRSDEVRLCLSGLG